mgnify:CR=1 FL=1
MAKFKKKPTIKEVANALIEVNKKVNDAFHVLRDIDNLLGLYIRMKNDLDEFNVFVKDKVDERKKEMEEKNDSKGNGSPDAIDIPTTPDDAGSGTEGIRAETK